MVVFGPGLTGDVFPLLPRGFASSGIGIVAALPGTAGDVLERYLPVPRGRCGARSGRSPVPVGEARVQLGATVGSESRFTR